MSARAKSSLTVIEGISKFSLHLADASASISAHAAKLRTLKVDAAFRYAGLLTPQPISPIDTGSIMF